MLLAAEHTDLDPHAFVAQHADVFAVFDATTQDSGNVSYGARFGEERLFIKTAGSPGDRSAFLSHDARVALLRNAVRLARAVSEWVDGELVGTPASRRSDPGSVFARFRSLDPHERAAALDAVFRLHVKLAQRGWIASDFYDGSHSCWR